VYFSLTTLSSSCSTENIFRTMNYVFGEVFNRDSLARKEFYKRASSQLSLLKSIGVSQMEKELEKEVKALEEKLSTSETELEEQDVKKSYTTY
jgi:hypothetical protein